jgi:hypothetical protein
MIIKVKLTQQEFINANLVLLYSKTSTKIFTGIILFFIVVSNIMTLSLKTGSFGMLVYPFFLLAFSPITTYLSAKRTFTTNKTAGEMIEYEFDDAGLLTKGETFNTQVGWNHIHKVTETKNWVLIWRNSQVANAIPKKMVWEERRNELKGILSKNNVKNNL